MKIPTINPRPTTRSTPSFRPRHRIRSDFRLRRSPRLHRREYLSQQRPNGWQVRDVHSDGGFAEVPVHVDVGDEAGDEAVDLCEDGGDDDEETHAEDYEEDGFLLHGEADAGEDGDADCEHGDVAGDVEAALDDLEELVGCALCYVSC